MSQVCIIESDKITDGGSLMRGNTNLIEWNSNLSNLTISDEMFSGCTSLVSFTGNLDNLETAGFNPFSDTTENYESGETVITTISTVESGMFYNCKSLKTFDIPLPSLKTASLMFYGTGLTEFRVDLSKLEVGTGMFQNSNLTSFSSNLSSLIKGGSHGDYYEVESGDGGTDENGYWHPTKYNYTEDCPSGMFENTNLTIWNIDLPNLEEGYRMFADCCNLTSFSGDLSSLYTAGYSIDGADYGYETIDGMFLNCVNLESFSSNISSVESAEGMFLNCFSLSSIGENTLENLYIGNLMFSGTKISSIDDFNFAYLSCANGMFLTCPFITNCYVPYFDDYWYASCMFGFNLCQLNELCEHNNIKINDLPISDSDNGQCIYLDNLNAIPIWSTCMFGVIPHQTYFSSQLTMASLPLPSGNNDYIFYDLGYEIDTFNPTLHLFCNDINSIINNSEGYDISFFVHGRHLRKTPDINDNTVEILTALASGPSIISSSTLGCITATSEIIDEFISFGWEYISDGCDLIYMGGECFSENYPQAITLGIPTQSDYDEYYYISIFHDGSWSNENTNN